MMGEEYRSKTGAEFTNVLNALRSGEKGANDSSGNTHHFFNCVRTISSLESTKRFCGHSLDNVIEGKIEGEIVPKDNSLLASVISGDGTEFIFRRRGEDGCRSSGSGNSKQSGRTPQLLPSSVSELKKQLKEYQTRVLANRGMDSRDGLDARHTSLVKDGSSHNGSDGDLWVQKYSPENFSELLSAERLNRNVLRHMKTWDLFVFGKKGSMGVVNRNGESMDKTHDGKMVDYAEDTTLSRVDERPHKRVILLSGTQGSGKTTLAKIVAEHCGYRPLFIGAGDDRSPEALKESLSRAMLGNTLSLENRPNCIIIDELDGVDSKASVDAIIKVIHTPLGGRKGGHTPLLRPLICICNDLYAPVLRDLRRHSAVYIFQPVEASRLAARLKFICASEHIKFPNSFFSSLASSYKGDIRGATNALQFSFSKSSLSSSTSSDEHQSCESSFSDIGNYKQHSSAHDIWSKVYHGDTLLSSRSGASRGAQGVTINRLGPRLSPLVHFFQCACDYSESTLLLSGLFENLSNIPYVDPSFTKTACALEWLSYGDSTISQTNIGGISYTPIVATALHIRCAVESNNQFKVEWPRKGKECSLSRSKNENVMRSLKDGSVLGRDGIRSVMTSKQISLDLICPLLDILSPPPQSSIECHSNVISKSEMETIYHAVRVMVSLGIQFNQRVLSRSSEPDDSVGDDLREGTYEPPIESFVDYQSSRDKESNRLGRHHIMPCAETAKLMSLELKKELHQQRRKSDVALSSPGKLAGRKRGTSEDGSGVSTTDGDRVGYESKETQINHLGSGSFRQCGRGGPGRMETQKLGATLDHRKKVRAEPRFKFNQGYSSAVRRPVTIYEFI